MSKSITRRRFLTLGATAAAGLTLPAAVQYEETNGVVLSRLDLAVPGLAPGLDGLRLAQISDLHLYQGGIHAAAEHTLRLLAAEPTDLVLLTGDQWDEPAGREVFPEWAARLPDTPVVAILGNHDYSSAGGGTQEARRHLARSVLERCGIDLLVNRGRTLAIRGEPLALVGLDDLRYGSPDPVAAGAGLRSGIPQIWLIHEPGAVDNLMLSPGDQPAAILSGHTHGGQVRVPGMPPLIPRGGGEYLAGWYATPSGRLYVSRGIGTSGLRARFRCRPELAIFTLRAA